MKLIDLDAIEFEQFDIRDDTWEEDEPVLVNYVSEDALRAMPVIDPVRRGAWITAVSPSYTHPGKVAVRKVCSECNHIFTIDFFKSDEWDQWYKDHWEPERKPTNFCEECGADMRKENT